MKKFRKESKAVRLAATSTVYSSYHQIPGILYHILYHGPTSTPSSFRPHVVELRFGSEEGVSMRDAAPDSAQVILIDLTKAQLTKDTPT